MAHLHTHGKLQKISEQYDRRVMLKGSLVEHLGRRGCFIGIMGSVGQNRGGGGVVISEISESLITD
jgi:hypothetical protein